MAKPVLTGPDYLIGAAEQLKGEYPLAQMFEDLIILAVMPSTLPSLPWSTPTEWAAKRDLKDYEATAVRVFHEAVRVAMAKKDRKALNELLAWGAGMLVRFEKYMEQRRTADEMPREEGED